MQKVGENFEESGRIFSFYVVWLKYAAGKEQRKPHTFQIGAYDKLPKPPHKGRKNSSRLFEILANFSICHAAHRQHREYHRGARVESNETFDTIAAPVSSALQSLVSHASPAAPGDHQHHQEISSSSRGSCRTRPLIPLPLSASRISSRSLPSSSRALKPAPRAARAAARTSSLSLSQHTRRVERDL